jgi:hypothetical protein
MNFFHLAHLDRLPNEFNLAKSSRTITQQRRGAANRGEFRKAVLAIMPSVTRVSSMGGSCRFCPDRNLGLHAVGLTRRNLAQATQASRNSISKTFLNPIP